MSPENILDFWFGTLDRDGLADEAHNARYWRKDPAFDAEIRDRYGALRSELLEGRHDGWLAAPRSRLAYLIVIDQFSRNAFRDDARAFEADGVALAEAKRGVEVGHDQAVQGTERIFYYLPFMHSEQLSDQNACIGLFEQFRAATRGRLSEALAQNVEFAVKHRDVIARFGRFPHRNEVLGRISTAEERAFLQQPGSSF